MATFEPGTELPELRVTPDRMATVRYAGASGDFNPIHVDEEFAKQVGLPGRILHGLWTMAQVARAQTEAAGGPHTLRRLSVQFRGMGVLEPGEDLPQDGDRVFRGELAVPDERAEARAGDVLGDEIGGVGVRVKAERTGDVGVHQAVDGHALALQVVDVLGVGGDFDGHELVDPDVVMGAPDLPEGPGADRLV